MHRKTVMIVKRIFDLLASGFVILFFFPFSIVISILIYEKMGLPIFFNQLRLGYKGQEFYMYKFRTMTDERDREGNLLPDEQRLTQLGSFLRRTTLDEIPELINVLKGEMSAVGPRPLLVDYRNLYTEEQWRRHDMPPGMAGPVLAGGRNALSWEEKFEQDIWYVDNWSLWLDAKILFQTMISVLKREGTSAEGHVTMPRFEGKIKDFTDDDL